jgi:hypothetical protein
MLRSAADVFGSDPPFREPGVQSRRRHAIGRQDREAQGIPAAVLELDEGAMVSAFDHGFGRKWRLFMSILPSTPLLMLTTDLKTGVSIRNRIMIKIWSAIRMR